MGPTWFRRGEDAEADGSKDDARNAHKLVNANSKYSMKDAANDSSFALAA